jgi:Putative adhesin
MSAPNPVPYYQPRPRSIIGPVVLIAIGVVALLATTGVVSRYALFMWFARYWPVLVIVWGVIKLGEYYWARSKGYPTPRLGGGSIVFLIFFIMFGFATTRLAGVNWHELGREIGDEAGIDWPPSDWGPSYEFSENFAAPLPGASQIKILNNSGDIKITASADNQAYAIVHKELHGSSQDEASRLNDSTHAKFAQQGSVWVLDLSGGDYAKGRFDLDLQLPRNAALSLTTRRGSISVSDRKGDVDVTTSGGDVTVEQVTGNAAVHMRGRSLSAKKISGDVTVEGGNNSDISDVGGSLTMTGSFAGGVQMTRIGKQVHFTTSRTDMQFARLDGELNMEMGDLRANSLTGPFKLDTRNKSVHLEDLSGEIHINNKSASVEVRPKAPLGAMDISNIHGEIDLTLPANAGFQLNAESVGGEVQTDFNVNVDNSNKTASARGNVGKGGPEVRLRADHGTIQVRKQ